MTGGTFNSSVREVLSMLECGGREYNHLFDCPHAGLTGAFCTPGATDAYLLCGAGGGGCV